MSNKQLISASSVLLSLVIMGCATSDSKSGGAKYTSDVERINAVQQGAAQNGVEVHWINPPKKRKEDGLK